MVMKFYHEILFEKLVQILTGMNLCVIMKFATQQDGLCMLMFGGQLREREELLIYCEFIVDYLKEWKAITHIFCYEDLEQIWHFGDHCSEI